MKRISAIDKLKGIGIILVLVGHAIPAGSSLHTFIYTFHMPLFFWCSGFFYKYKPWNEAIKRDAKGLLIPYLVFIAFLFVTAFVISCNSGNYSLLSINPFDRNCYCLYYTIWFLPCLFLVKQLYLLLCHCARNNAMSITGGGNYLLYSILCNTFTKYGPPSVYR